MGHSTTTPQHSTHPRSIPQDTLPITRRVCPPTQRDRGSHATSTKSPSPRRGTAAITHEPQGLHSARPGLAAARRLGKAEREKPGGDTQVSSQLQKLLSRKALITKICARRLFRDENRAALSARLPAARGGRALLCGGGFGLGGRGKGGGGPPIKQRCHRRVWHIWEMKEEHNTPY